MAQNENHKNDDLKKQKEMFAQACYSAWFVVSLEKLKQLILLSSGAIGVLLLFRSDIVNISRFIFWALAIICFTLTIATILFFSIDNASKVIADTVNNRKSSSEKNAKIFDKISTILFLCGIIFSIVLVVLILDITIVFS